MDARFGKEARLGRILRPETGRAVVVAASHPVMSGPIPGLRTREDITRAFSKINGADAVMISPGMLPLIHEKFVGRDKPGLILHLDWKNVGRSVYTPGKDGRSEGVLAQMAAIEDVAAAGFDAVMTYLYLGQMDSRLERAEIERNAHIARDCEKYGIGLIIEPRSALEGTDVGSHSAPVMTTYCRIAADLGADLVKCVWPDSLETWQEITETCYVPVLLAGGPGGDDVPDTLRLARDTVDRGGAGVMFGRRVFCAKDPVDVLKQLGDVVHNGASVS